MINEFKPQPSKTYKTRENALKAVEKFYGECEEMLRFMVVQNDEGRFYPIFIGQNALQCRVFQQGFTVVA